MPFFSIVVPLYNKQKDIKQTLLSALSQTFRDFELIVINDGSTDGSEAEVVSITDERLIYQKTENQGVSAARNLGIEKAKGNYIAFLDADDYWYPDHLETLKNLADIFPHAGAVAANYEFKHPNGTITNTFFEDIDTDFKGIVKDFFKSSMLFRVMWTSAVAVKKDVFLKTGIFDTSITLGAGEDTDMWIRIALAYPIAFNAKITATYNLGSSNRISHAQTLKRSFAKLDKFKQEEMTNKNLQKFIDLYRASYALKHKLAGDTNTYNYYKHAITKGNIPLKTRLILNLPTPLLQALYGVKQKLKSLNINFDIYN
jgi:glycosyltransferase involved in cell wall biosynthesis